MKNRSRKRWSSIPAGPFVRGTTSGGFDEQPQRTIYLDTFSIDRYEVTNHQYQQFVLATGHRKAAPPSRYAKSVGKMRGTESACRLCVLGRCE